MKNLSQVFNNSVPTSNNTHRIHFYKVQSFNNVSKRLDVYFENQMKPIPRELTSEWATHISTSFPKKGLNKFTIVDLWITENQGTF